MKKFILLLSIVACFGIAKSQTVSEAIFLTPNGLMDTLGLILESFPAQGGYKISQLGLTGFSSAIVIQNNTENDMSAGDSIKVEMKYNGQQMVTWTLTLSEKLEKDSLTAFKLNEYILIGGISKEGYNSICYNVVQYNETPVTTDEGDCTGIHYTLKEAPTSISENTLESVKVYPNPVRNMLNIDNLSTEANISIYNMAGQLVISEQAVSGTNSIDLSSLSAGLYIVRMQDGNNVRTEKVQVIK